MKYILKSLFFSLFFPLFFVSLQAQITKKPDVPPDAVALVDGVPIKKTALEKVITSSGLKSSAEVRGEVLKELVLREVLSAEAIRRGTDRKADFLGQLNEVKQRLLADTLLTEYVTQNPITEKEIQAEYERQKIALGGDSAPQYSLSQIVVATEQEGRDIVARLRKGDTFDKLASSLSKDEASKAKGGQLGWFLPLELAPVFGNVIVNLTKGGFTAAPIQFNNQWHVLRVDDTRPFKVPSLEESRQRLVSALQNQKRQKLVDDLLKKANIQVGNL